jgi:SAM-dependent methyltransferase
VPCWSIDDTAEETMNRAADDVIPLYERHHRAWDAARGADFPEKPWIDRFRALLGPGADILDLGCGSGRPIAAYLLENGYRVTGLDASPGLIGLARDRLPEGCWRVGDMRYLSLSARFDGLLAWDSLFHLTVEDQRRTIPLLSTHASPGAALLFTSGPEAGEVIGEWQSEPLYHASLSPCEYRALLGRFGFSIVGHAIADPACGGRTIWLAKKD